MRKPLPSPEEIARLPADGGPEFNRLIHEKSPYLLQHARNPVDWYPWGAEAFARARKEDKPVFLSIGYSTCHWCHVMEAESFERVDVAKILNDHFVAIKVDREERPDIDEIYMTATQLFTGQGGWPNSVWLTPEGKPWYAGTYFPREDYGGRPGFKTLLLSLADVWRNRRRDVETQVARIAEALKQATSTSGVVPMAALSREVVCEAVRELLEGFDEVQGGFGGAPKFPPHGSLRLLLHECRRGGDETLLKMTRRTLDAMALGGIRDHLGGGFHRYSTDEHWFLPHFEKMLYDNAQLGRAYVDAYVLTGDEDYRRVAEGVYGWVLREMTDEGGGFYSAIDADSEGEEGRFYVWRRDEIVRALGEEEGGLFCRVYGVEPDGNFRAEATGETTGANILYLRKRVEELASAERTSAEALRERIGAAREKLLEARKHRVRPHLDDKVLASWNGLMIGSLAHAGLCLKQPRYTEAARKAADFVLARMCSKGRLLRSYRAGEAKLNAYLDDYAFLADGLLDLREATGEDRWLEEAKALMATLMKDYADEGGGFFFTAADHEELLYRSKTAFDHALPSGNGVAAQALLRLGELTGEARYADAAKAALDAFLGPMQRAPRGTEGLILAAAIYLDQAGAAQPREAGETPDARAGGHPVTVEAYASHRRAAPGATIHVALRVAVAPAWHIQSHAPRQEYLKATAVALRPSAGAVLGEVGYPPGRDVNFAFSGDALSVYEGAVWLAAPVRLAADAKASPVKLVFEVRTQACHETACLAPETHELTVELEIDPRAGGEEARHRAIFEKLGIGGGAEAGRR